MKQVTMAVGVVNAVLVKPTIEVRRATQAILSFDVKGAEHSDVFKKGHWDGRSSLYSAVKNKFPAGFVPLVRQQLTKRGYTVNVVRRDAPEPLGPRRPIVDAYGYDDSDFDYQSQAGDRFCKAKRMIAQVATGGGKSRIALIITGQVFRPTMFITTRTVLAYQMHAQYESMLTSMKQNHPELGIVSTRAGMIGDGLWEPAPMINVAMVQTLSARMASKDPIERQRVIALLRSVQLCILEEAHEAGGNEYYEILGEMRDAYYRLALTATPFMRGDQEANMRLMAVTGPIGVKITEKELIERGVLATPQFKFIDSGKPDRLFKTTKWPKCSTLGVVENQKRNARIVLEALKARKLNVSVLVLVQRREHGKLLKTLLINAGLKTDYIFGDTTQPARIKALKALGSGELDVLIGSTILDVGVDVPSIGMIINAGGGKAEVNFRQRIGRGLRRKKNGPNVAFVVDFDDRYNQTLHDHSRQRKGLLMATPGFAERVLPDGEEFDFSMFK